MTLIKRIITILLLMLFFLVGFAPPNQASAQPLAGIVSTRNSGLNVRRAPASYGTWLTSLPRGSFVRLIALEDGWWKVEYDRDRYGYCDADYIAPHAGESGTVKTNGSNLNVRNGASTFHEVCDKLPNGTEVVILAESAEWMYILYHGTKTGYVSADYIETPDSLRTVSLQVPCYRQKNSRWRNIKLGNSGKTLGQIGCTTTCLAMTESYRTGKTVTPATMAKTLSYSTSGDLYWTSRYEDQCYDESVALQRIYDALQSGRPVLYGSKTRSGRSHWVVVIGFSGDELTPDNFIIHDPGSNYRTSLADHVAAYPVYYKTVFYHN